MAGAVSRTSGRTSGGWFARIRSVFGQAPVHEASGRGRRSLAWMPSNPGAVAALLASGADLRIKSRDLVRRNAWAQAGIEAFVANAVGTGIKPQSLSTDDAFKAEVQALWRDWTAEADAAGQTDFYGLQALACRAMLEGGECLIRLRPRREEDGLAVPLQLQLLEAEHLPMHLNTDLPSGNVVRAGIEFDGLGRRVAYHLYRSHPDDGRLAPMSGQGGLDTVRVDASEIIHLFRVLRPGQIRGEPWLSRALVKLNELDQYDDAELVRKKTAAMFAGFVTRQSPEDNLMGEGLPDEAGISLVGLEPGTLQILEPGEDIKFSDPADVGGSYGEFLRTQFRAVAAALGITYEQLTGDLTGVNYSSIRAGLLEFRRRCEMVQHSVLVHQMCRPVWAAWMKQAVLAGALVAPGFARGGAARRRQYLQAKWVPQGWQWVDPEKEFKAMLLAIRAGLMSRSEAISTFGYDAEDIDREIAADNARADALGLVFDSDPRHTAKDGAAASRTGTTTGEPVAA
ncbi:phage portal protein [Ralstonia solanacearum]|uniref:phage portal protein n=1 Tax=Ralstonia solanacearum TaxID=305 RepID=UPI0005C699D3|nr:phage portal protein [Ralstonia solanacearum]MBB6589901.1 phage portal protein [Ralstonia solanacearum]MBB6594097.1 phage portal protein [Ralstonia solanacearum]MDB0540295.1 phage portal protein [Ralstonia solanacearum]MDB0550661.1 phage portal protein [Ralstonia solanacearum]MDB0555229.1 phage portal protein [Ralstonia solanacearum]